ncbi:DUF5677 domain-containing protein [Cellulomonas sp. Root137]|uniref:DUF5677 domain-containing protein n=1 Tax=Cellulomonas sp. Root137 TaxID=1736459 RepID=UPI0012E37C14|nr:DUF5677 domain-containing protein [Cellulomonas sp. Root137]
MHRIVTAAANDAIALVDHVDRFDGRSAAHAARAMFEHLINLCDVISSTDNTPDRYLEHRHVTADQVSQHRWYLDLLDPAARKKEKDRLDKLARTTAAPLKAALAKWTTGFKRGWAKGTLKERADLHGLGDGYEGYRILSGVIHGSSGALAGIVRDIKGTPVHRVGPDLDLAATAYREGLVSFWSIADRLLVLTGGPEAEQLKGRTGNLLLGIQEVSKALRREDKNMWPTEPPPAGRVPLLAVYPSGRTRWFIVDTRTETMVVADPPAVEPDGVAAAIALARQTDPNADGRPVTFPFEANVPIRPRVGASWVSTSSVLMPPGHPARHDTPIGHKP